MDSMPAIVDYVFRHAAHSPDLKAIADEHSSYTYGALAPRVRALADQLRRIGIGRGEFVAAMTPPRADAYTLFLALNAIGAIWLGLNPRYTLRELGYIVGDAKPKAMFFVSELDGREYLEEVKSIVTTNACVENVICLDGATSDETLGEIWGFETFLAGGSPQSDAADSERVGDDIAAIIYTSGSTGRPKGALLPNRCMVHRALVQNEDYVMRAGRPHCYVILPINHVGSIVLTCAFSMVNGGSLTFRQRFDPHRVGRDVFENGINFLVMVPTMYQQVFASPEFSEADYRNCQVFFWGGANLPREFIRRLRTMGHGEVRTNYGATELCSSVTRTDPDLDIDVLAQTVGYALDDELRVVKEDGTLARIGEVGEAHVRRQWIMAGYLNRPEAFEEAVTEDGEWFRTGDLMELMEDGKNLRFVGRMSDMFKAGGHNVYPREIEEWLEEHPAVEMAAVLGKKDPLFDEVGHAVVLSRAGRGSTEDEMREWCRKGLANYKVPKSFEFRSEMPMLGTGKIDRMALRAQMDTARDDGSCGRDVHL
jgi:acyl-CoA synthetase (AMP-forming)/AMP-acid ligase II